MFFNVKVLNQRKVLFEGEAKSLVLPGEEGVFEVLPYHKTLLSRLVKGNIMVDGKSIPIKRGVIKVHENTADVIVEEA